MKRVRLLILGIALLLLGAVFLFLSSSICKIIGGIGYFTGAVTCSIYNIEKFKFYRALRKEARKRLYIIPIRPIVSSILCFFFLFSSTAFIWGYLMCMHIVSPLVNRIVGFVYFLFLIPCVLSWEVDKYDKEIIMSIMQQMEERYDKRT